MPKRKSRPAKANCCTELLTELITVEQALLDLCAEFLLIKKRVTALEELWKK